MEHSFRRRILIRFGLALQLPSSLTPQQPLCESVLEILALFMGDFWIKIKLKVLIFLTIQKSYYMHFSFMAEFVDALRSAPFTGVHYKRWQAMVTLWLTSMGVFWVSNGKLES
jgi:hypothetical protein